MSKPTLEYFWVKVLPDGKTVIPQFDLETGKQNLWHSDEVELSKVLLVPFSTELANKVIQQGNLAVVSTNPIIELKVESGEQVEAGIDGEITVFDYFECTSCGWKFQYMKTEGSKFAECPQCGEKDKWYCSRCEEYKTDFRITERNQVQCLDCEIPTGLDRTETLLRKQAVAHRCDYFIRSDSKTVTVSDGCKKIIIE